MTTATAKLRNLYEESDVVPSYCSFCLVRHFSFPMTRRFCSFSFLAGPQMDVLFYPMKQTWLGLTNSCCAGDKNVFFTTSKPLFNGWIAFSTCCRKLRKKLEWVKNYGQLFFPHLPVKNGASRSSRRCSVLFVNAWYDAAKIMVWLLLSIFCKANANHSRLWQILKQIYVSTFSCCSAAAKFRKEFLDYLLNLVILAPANIRNGL